MVLSLSLLLLSPPCKEQLPKDHHAYLDNRPIIYSWQCHRSTIRTLSPHRRLLAHCLRSCANVRSNGITTCASQFTLIDKAYCVPIFIGISRIHRLKPSAFCNRAACRTRTASKVRTHQGRRPERGRSAIWLEATARAGASVASIAFCAFFVPGFELRST